MTNKQLCNSLTASKNYLTNMVHSNRDLAEEWYADLVTRGIDEKTAKRWTGVE